MLHEEKSLAHLVGAANVHVDYCGKFGGSTVAALQLISLLGPRAKKRLGAKKGLFPRLRILHLFGFFFLTLDELLLLFLHRAEFFLRFVCAFFDEDFGKRRFIFRRLGSHAIAGLCSRGVPGFKLRQPWRDDLRGQRHIAQLVFAQLGLGLRVFLDVGRGCFAIERCGWSVRCGS